MIPAQALVSAIPDVTKRGAFQTPSAPRCSSSPAASRPPSAGTVIAEAPGGALLHFNWLGYIVMAVSLLSLTLMYFVHKAVSRINPGPGAAEPGGSTSGGMLFVRKPVVKLLGNRNSPP